MDYAEVANFLDGLAHDMRDMGGDLRGAEALSAAAMVLRTCAGHHLHEAAISLLPVAPDQLTPMACPGEAASA